MTDISDVFGGAIDASAPIKEGASFSTGPLPPGKYTMKVLETERRVKGDDEYLNVKFEIVGGDFNGKWHWNDYALLIPSNADRTRMGRADLTRLVAATGLTTCSDTDVLIDRKFMVEVFHKGQKLNGDPWVNMRGYSQVADPAPLSDTAAPAAPDALEQIIGTDEASSNDTLNDDIPF